MAAAEAIIYALQRNWEMVDAAMDGLDEATLARQPADQCNSISWILWHQNRVVDTFIHTRLRSTDQLWTRDGWHQQFGMPADPEDRGVAGPPNKYLVGRRPVWTSSWGITKPSKPARMSTWRH